MAEMFTVRLCDEALDTEQEVEADAETTFQVLLCVSKVLNTMLTYTGIGETRYR